MNIKNIIVITGLAILTAGCFEDDDVEVINPQSMKECIPIKNMNKRDQCKMQVTEYLSKKGMDLKKRSLGSKKSKYF